MEKRWLAVLLIVLLAVSVSADKFDWELYIQGGDLDYTHYAAPSGKVGITTTIGAAIGTIIGALLGNVWGAAIGAGIGGGLGNSIEAGETGMSAMYVATFGAEHYSIYDLQFGTNSNSKCGGNARVTEYSGLFDVAGPLDIGVSQTFEYEHALAIGAGINGRKASFQSGLKRRVCRYRMSLSYKMARLVTNDTEITNRRHGARSLGPLDRYIDSENDSLGPGQEYKIFSRNPKVLVWFGTDAAQGKDTTVETSVGLYSCEDTDENDICDYIQQEVFDCEAKEGAWYGNKCCGVNDQSAGQFFDVQPCNNLPDSPTGVHEKFVDRTNNVEIDYKQPAVCGLNADGDPEWAYIQDVGGVHELTQCNNLNLVSDGEKYHHCIKNPTGPQLSKLGSTEFEEMEIEFGGKLHTYTCIKENITECTGFDLPLSDFDGGDHLDEGKILISKDGHTYCRDNGTIGVDLDYSPVACRQSLDADGNYITNKWTGHYCCGEDLDTADERENYNDPFDVTAFADVQKASAGGCFLGNWTPQGRYLIANNTINVQGVYWGCNVAPELAAEQDTQVPGNLIQDAGTCGKLHLADEFLDKPFAVCQPWGQFSFTATTGSSLIKSVPYNVSALEEPGNIRQEGCCPDTNCWNGTDCQTKGSFYRIGDEGYQCR
jgi:hypothetical protein